MNTKKVTIILGASGLLASARPSVRMEQLVPYWWDFHKISYLSIFFFRNFSEKIQVSLKSAKNSGYFTCRSILIFFIISRSVPLRMRNVSHESCWEVKTHILCSKICFPQNGAVYKIMWRNIVQPGKPRITTGRMRIACRIPKTRNTLSEYVIIIAFPLQQRLHECASILRHTYMACLVQNTKYKCLPAVIVQNAVLMSVTSCSWRNMATLLSVFKICLKYTNI
jgi:hypothetical protein